MSISDWMALLFGFVGLSFAFAVTYHVFRFHVRSLKRWGISRSDLQQTRRKVVKYALISWPVFVLIFIVVNLSEPQIILTWYFLLLCLLGPLLYSLSIIAGQVAVLAGVYRLPMTDSDGEKGDS